MLDSSDAIDFSQRLQRLDTCLLRDRFRLQRDIKRAKDLLKRKKPVDALLEKVDRRIVASQTLLEARLNNLPSVTYSEELPIAQRRDDILEALNAHQVIVLAGETGSGKTTQLPKMCLELGRGVLGTIGHTQPRRLAARAVAQRIADELNVELGQQVGYQVRFTDRSNDLSLIKLMTDGILLAEIQHDPFLNQYDTLIIDEAHERSLNIDFLLGYLAKLLPRRPDLKVIITSATIDLERFSKHFNDAPVIEVSGRTYPVSVHYRPVVLESEGEGSVNDDSDMPDRILQVLDEIEAEDRSSSNSSLGDVLVFLSGEREIRETAERLRKADLANTEILPLYARLSSSDQQRVFASHTGRRVVLSTNVAETSLTVPGIRYVIDTGFARISRYCYRSKIQRLQVEPVSQASANQRKGRCGRVAEGICYRLYSEEDFLLRSEFTDAEILRTNLAAVILQMQHLRLGDIEKFPFIDAPDQRVVKDGVRLLQALGALDTKRVLTDLGRILAKFPLEPRFSRILVAANKQGCLREALIIVSALAAQDPRERPIEARQAANEKHKVYEHEESDFLSFVNIWEMFEEQRQELSKNQLRRFCKKQFLSVTRMQEWRETHHQLKVLCKELKFVENTESADYSSIHISLLTGLIDHIANKNDEGEYIGARNRKAHIFPGSSLAKRKPKWIMAAELLETSRLFARTVAIIQPEWIEPLAEHLIKRTHFEPHWEKRRQQVVGYEQITLYGIVIVARRRIAYAKIDSVKAREIFIQSALVEGQLQTKAAFYQANQQLITDVEKLEDKSRRRDILVDDAVVYEFYDKNIPAHICNTVQLERWLKKEAHEKVLHLSMSDLMQHDASEVTEQCFPSDIGMSGIAFPLDYRFDPLDQQDGVTIQVPAACLRQVSKDRIEWLVPGMLRDKCIALVKSLPKAIRRELVPVPEHVDEALTLMSPSDHSLCDALAESFRKMKGVKISREDWKVDSLASCFAMNISVLDDQGKVLKVSKDLDELITEYADLEQEQVQQMGSHDLECDGLTSWSTQDLPQDVTISKAGLSFTAYPAFVDQKDSVAVKVFTDAAYAKRIHRQGLIRLALLAFQDMSRFIRDRSLKTLKAESVYYSKLGKTDQLFMDAWYSVVHQVCFGGIDDADLPYNKAEFDDIISSARSKLDAKAQEFSALLSRILRLYHGISKTLKGKTSLDVAYVLSDVKSHVESLVFPGFIAKIPPVRLQEYPRYLQACEGRLTRFKAQLNKERVWIEEVQDFSQRYKQALEKADAQQKVIANLEAFRWMIEEYRVSLYAQQLGTKMPVSVKRLNKFWSELVL